MLFYLQMIVEFLDKAIKGAADLTGFNDNKHFLTGMFLIQRYYPELKAAAARTDNTLDDKIVDELYETSQHFWPLGSAVTQIELDGNDITSYVEAKVTELTDIEVAIGELLAAKMPAQPHSDEDPDTGPHS